MIFAVRRPSCPFCQLTAVQLSLLKTLFEKHHVRCYAVSHQTEGINSFVERFWPFTDATGMPSLLIDERSVVFKALGGRVAPSEGGDDTAAAVARLRSVQPSYAMELEGENTLLGGVVVVDPARGVIYAELENTVGALLAGEGEKLAQAVERFYAGDASL